MENNVDRYSINILANRVYELIEENEKLKEKIKELEESSNNVSKEN